MIRYSEPQTIRMHNNSEVLLVDCLATFSIPAPSLLQLRGEKKRMLVPLFDDDSFGITATFPDIAGYEHIRNCARKSGGMVAVCVTGGIHDTNKGASITLMFGIKNCVQLASGRIDYDIDIDTPMLVLSQSQREMANRTLGIVFLDEDIKIKLSYTLVPNLQSYGAVQWYRFREIKRKHYQPANLICVAISADRDTRGVPGELFGYHETYRGIFYKDGDVSKKVQEYLEDTQDTLDSDTFEFFWEML